MNIFGNKSASGIVVSVLLAGMLGGLKLYRLQWMKEDNEQRAAKREQEVRDQFDQIMTPNFDSRMVDTDQFWERTSVHQMQNKLADSRMDRRPEPRTAAPTPAEQWRPPTDLDASSNSTGQSPDVARPASDQAIAADGPAEPEPMLLIYSPPPEERELERYERWVPTEDYAEWLDEPYHLADWSFSPSTEFELDGRNARTAEWDVQGGQPGVGLDVQLYALYPRDREMACPVVRDEPGRQVFRLGRREARADGDATIQYKDVNGLMVWRIHIPPSAGSKLGTCYYTAIADEQAIVFTARYNSDKPGQLVAFDAIASSLAYSGR